MILKSIFEINSEIFTFFTYKGPCDLKEVTHHHYGEIAEQIIDHDLEDYI